MIRERANDVNLPKHMKERPKAIVALFARGREIGFAVLVDGELVRFGLKTIKGRRRGSAFTRAVERALSPLLEAADPHGVIVRERTAECSRLGALCRVMERAFKHWKRGYTIHTIPLATVKKRLCGSLRSTHRELVEAVRERHPALYSSPASGREQISIAVALAEGASLSLEKRVQAS